MGIMLRVCGCSQPLEIACLNCWKVGEAAALWSAGLRVSFSTDWCNASMTQDLPAWQMWFPPHTTSLLIYTSSWISVIAWCSWRMIFGKSIDLFKQFLIHCPTLFKHDTLFYTGTDICALSNVYFYKCHLKTLVIHDSTALFFCSGAKEQSQ